MRFTPLSYTCLIAGLVLAAAAALDPAIGKRIYIPATRSVPMDLYWAAEGEARVGDFVLVRVPRAAEDIARARDYYTGAPLWIKQVAGSDGDHVCIAGGQLLINGSERGSVHDTDRQGRPLPTLSICRSLRADELFVMGTDGRSFDSRYFGPVQRASIVTRLNGVFASLTR
jgi:conjugative transfer signal peptidase TraF